MRTIEVTNNLVSKEAHHTGTKPKQARKDLVQTVRLIKAGREAGQITQWFNQHRPGSPYTELEAVQRVLAYGEVTQFAGQ